MGKFTNAFRLSRQEQNDLIIDFVKSVASLRNPVEAANYIKDLLSEPEVLILSRRLQIARLLTDGQTYEQIHKITRASYTTIARVQTWLKMYGDGYRMVIKRTESKGQDTNTSSDWHRLKQRYPMYYWPELLLKEIIKSASLREKRKLLAVINGLKEKSRVSKQLTALLNPIKHTLQ